MPVPRRSRIRRLQLLPQHVDWGTHWDDWHSGVGVATEQPRFGNGQAIYVLHGIGRCQRRSGPIEIISHGDRGFFEPGEDHWHGAAPDRFMTHPAMLEVDDNANSTIWGSDVTEQEYAAVSAST